MTEAEIEDKIRAAVTVVETEEDRLSMLMMLATPSEKEEKVRLYGDIAVADRRVRLATHELEQLQYTPRGTPDND